ncbi:MAG TPA: ABC transporter substrate-binding protein [Candidatus Paceibacterota bacterium]
MKKLVIALGIVIVVGAGVLFLMNSGGTTTPAGTTLTPMQLPVTIGLVKYIPPLEANFQGFKTGLQELGYVEGRDVIYKEDIANGSIDKLHEISKNFISQGVGIIYAFPVEAAVAAYQETVAAGRTDIPIVMGGSNKPENFGLVKSYQSSGTNVTGIAIDLTNVTAKKLEFLRQLLPNAKKVGIIIEKEPNLAAGLVLGEFQKHASGLGFETVRYDLDAAAPGPEATAKLQTLLGGIKPGDIDAMFQVPGTIVTLPQNVPIIGQASVRLKAPIVALAETTSGGFSALTYNFDLPATGKQAAAIVDKVIKGVKPTDIPIEYPGKNILTINTKYAQSLGITVPQSLLGIADKIISQ